MAKERTLLVLLQASEAARLPLEGVARRAGFALELTDSATDAVRILGMRRPTAVLADSASPGAEQLCRRARFERASSEVVVLVACRKLTDTAFARALDWGADDALLLGAERALVARLRALPEARSVPPPGRGTALVAERDHQRAKLLGRVLGHAGFQVRMASSSESLLEAALAADLELIVAGFQSVDPLELATAMQNSRAAFLVTAPPDELEHANQILVDHRRAVVMSDLHSPENILYVANELKSQAGREVRAEPRLLYGTLVAYRAAGDEEDDYGFSYNVSAGGMYVRTLAPPSAPLVSLDLRPPGNQRRRVRLTAEVIWKAGLGGISQATAPPGFGLRISGGLLDDAKCWQEGVAALLEETRAAARFHLPGRDSGSRSATTPARRRPRQERPRAPPAPLTTPESDGPESDGPESDDDADRRSSVSIATAIDAELQQRVRLVAAAAPLVPLPCLEVSAGMGGDLDRDEASERGPPVPPSGPPGADIATQFDSGADSAATPSDRVHPSTAEELLAPAPEKPAGQGPQISQQGCTDATPLPTCTAPPRYPSLFRLLLVGVLAMAAGGAFGLGALSLRAPALRQTGPHGTTAPSVKAPASQPRVTGSGPAPRASSLASTRLPQAAAIPPLSSSGEQDLSPRAGYLTVTGREGARVFVNGKDAGPTGARLEVPCGFRFVRIGALPGPVWLAPGRTVDVTCRATTVVSMGDAVPASDARQR